MRLVYNAEPYGYSKVAIENWTAKGFQYREGSWKEIAETDVFEDVEILIVRLEKKVEAKILDKFPNLKGLVSATTGHDHLDVEELKKRNISLHSLRGHDEFLKTIPSTAELTWAIILGLLRNLPTAFADVKNGNWNRDAFRGFQLKDKTIGIIGLGRTGRKIARYAQAFDMKIGYYDPYVSNNELKKYDSLEELFSNADIISIHVHLKDDTKHLINSNLLSKCKSDAYIINTSRGKIWNEIDIVDALKTGNLKGVASDVLYNELENIEQSPLWKYAQNADNVLITPHIGGASWDAMWACEIYMTELPAFDVN